MKRLPAGIRGWPAAERPREKLAARGAHSLGDADLLAILLRTGTKGKSAVELAMGLLKRFGTLKNLAARLPRELREQAGLGEAKAATVVAALELGRRLASERDRPRAQFKASADVAAHFSPLMRHLKREVFKIALLDSAHRLIRTKSVTGGTLNLALVHPREVFREAVVESAAGLVLVHNHPSGDPVPSDEDVRLTRQLVGAGETLGIQVLDHVIIGTERHYSFADSRRL